MNILQWDCSTFPRSTGTIGLEKTRLFSKMPVLFSGGATAPQSPPALPVCQKLCPQLSAHSEPRHLGVLCYCARFCFSVALLTWKIPLTAACSGPDTKIHIIIFKIYRESPVFIFSLKPSFINCCIKGSTSLKIRPQMPKGDKLQKTTHKSVV